VNERSSRLKTTEPRRCRWQSSHHSV